MALYNKTTELPMKGKLSWKMLKSQSKEDGG